MERVSVQLWQLIQNHENAFVSEELKVIERALDALLVWEDAASGQHVQVPADRVSEALSLLQKKDEGLLAELPCPPNSVYWHAVGQFPTVSQFDRAIVYGDGRIFFGDGEKTFPASEIGDTIVMNEKEAKIKTMFNCARNEA